MITTVSTISPLTSTPLVSPAHTSLPPGYGLLHLANAWYPCRILQGQPRLIATATSENEPWVSSAGYEQAQRFCFEDAELAHYACFEDYPDRVLDLCHLLFEQTGDWPRWQITAGHAIAVGIRLDQRFTSPEMVSYAPSLYQALLGLAEEVERQRQEAEQHSWEAWRQELAPVR